MILFNLACVRCNRIFYLYSFGEIQPTLCCAHACYIDVSIWLVRIDISLFFIQCHPLFQYFGLNGRTVFKRIVSKFGNKKGSLKRTL